MMDKQAQFPPPHKVSSSVPNHLNCANKILKKQNGSDNSHKRTKLNKQEWKNQFKCSEGWSGAKAARNDGPRVPRRPCLSRSVRSERKTSHHSDSPGQPWLAFWGIEVQEGKNLAAPEHWMKMEVDPASCLPQNQNPKWASENWSHQQQHNFLINSTIIGLSLFPKDAKKLHRFSKSSRTSTM